MSRKPGLRVGHCGVVIKMAGSIPKNITAKVNELRGPLSDGVECFLGKVGDRWTYLSRESAHLGV
jgi:hypothetical protein